MRRRRLVRGLDHQIDARSGDLAQPALQPRQQHAQIQAPQQGAVLVLREGAQPAGHLFAASPRRQGRLAQPADAVRIVGVAQQHVQGGGHDVQQGGEILRHTARKTPDIGHAAFGLGT